HITLTFGHIDIPCESRSALTLIGGLNIFPSIALLLHYDCEPVDFAHELCDVLRETCCLKGSHEHLFLLLYFNRIIEKLRLGFPICNVLLPLPKARFYFRDQNSITTDFVFWTGERFVAVFMHESTYDHQGRADEAMLKARGFEVYSLIATEFESRGLMGDTGT